MESGLALILTQIGSATGFIAFLMKVWEFYHDRRPKLRIERSLNSDPDWGNTITVLNSSKVGTSIHYYMLAALPKWWRMSPIFPDRRAHIEFSLEQSNVNIAVPPHGHVDIEFRGEHHFNWGVSRTDDLYLRVWTAFRKKPYTFLVVGARGR